MATQKIKKKQNQTELKKKNKRRGGKNRDAYVEV